MLGICSLQAWICKGEGGTEGSSTLIFYCRTGIPPFFSAVSIISRERSGLWQAAGACTAVSIPYSYSSMQYGSQGSFSLSLI